MNQMKVEQMILFALMEKVKVSGKVNYGIAVRVLMNPMNLVTQLQMNMACTINQLLNFLVPAGLSL